MGNSDTAMEKKKEDLTGRVFDPNNLIAYQDGSVVSRMLVYKPSGTITLFAFDAGEGLSEHAAPYDAVVMITDGEADITIGGTPHHLVRGQMVIMPANVPHAIHAVTRFRMMLTMIHA